MLYLGFDIVVTNTGEVFVLEINDSPGDIYGSLIPNKNVSNKYVSFLKLAKLKGINNIIIMLSDKYECNSVNELFSIHLKTNDLLSGQILWLYKQSKKQGINLEIVDYESSKTISSTDSIFIRRGTRSLNFHGLVEINPLAVRDLCRDKYLCHKILRSNHVPSVDTYLYQRKGCTISKPRYGYGSIDVSLVTDKALPSSLNDFVYQEKMSLDSVNINGFDYHYDIRVNMLAGKVMCEIVRISACPNNGIFEATDEAVWLTSTGDSIERMVFDGENSIPWDKIEDVCRKAYETIHQHFNQEFPKYYKSKIDPYKAFRIQRKGVVSAR
ncbi:TPA: hypothetical protein I7286_08710 [Vibrio parahaemolyticus]|nr:hypothetical protein [Vibrio parahaemolyticus]